MASMTKKIRRTMNLHATGHRSRHGHNRVRGMTPDARVAEAELREKAEARRVAEAELRARTEVAG